MVVSPCTKCGLPWPKTADYYSPDRKMRSGFKSHCKRCASAETRRWIQAHREQKSETNRQYHLDHLEQRRADARSHHAENRDRANARSRQYYQDHKQEYRLRERAIQANRRAAPGKATKEQVVARILFYGSRCWMCGDPWSHIDHVKPLAAGGTNWPANLRPACGPCNLRKGARWPFPVQTRIFAPKG